MAFECGALGRADGRSPQEIMSELLAYLRDQVPGLEIGKHRAGAGWVSVRVRVDRAGGMLPEQNIQVSVGGEILAVYLEDALPVLGKDRIRGRDLMLTTIQTGEIDRTLNEKLMDYAVRELHGIIWDEASGFILPE